MSMTSYDVIMTSHDVEKAYLPSLIMNQGE